MDKKELQTSQIMATSRLCLEFEEDSGSVQEKIDTLRQMLRIKEIASRKLAGIFNEQIIPLQSFGISDLSVLGIAEALYNELVTNLGEMEVIADRLATVTHNNDIRDAYGNISERLLGDVTDRLDIMKITREEAVNDDEVLQKVEWGDMFENLNEEIKQIIS